MNNNAILAAFAQSVLAGYPRAQLARLLPDLEELWLNPGERLYGAGETADRLFLILDGALELSLPPRADTSRAAPRRLDKHGFCGIEAIAGHASYAADAVALNPAHILVFSPLGIAKLLGFNPHFKLDLILSQSEAPPTPEAAPRKPTRSTSDTIRESVGWMVAMLGPWAAYLLARHYQFDLNQGIFIGIFTATMAMWVFGLADIFVPSLFIVLALLVLAPVPNDVVLSGFASGSLFMAMSVLGLGALIVNSGLGYRFLLLLLRFMPKNQFFYNFNLLLAGTLLCPMVPSINGRAAMIAPFLVDMADILKAPPRGRASNLLAISSFTGITLFSPIFLSSKSVNFVVYGLLPAQVQSQFHGLGWLFAASVTGAVMLVLYLAAAALWLRNREPVRLSTAMVKAQWQILGPMQPREWPALVGVCLFAVGVVVASFIHIDPPWTALTLLFALLLSGVLSPDEFRSQIDWPFLVFLAGIVGMVNSMRHLKLDTWLAGQLGWMGSYMVTDLPTFILLLTAVVTLIRLVVPISATIVIVATVFIPIAVVAGVNPWLVGFIILIVGELWFLPYQCSYYLQFRQLTADQGIYDENRFLLFNALMNVAKILAIYASIPFWKYLGVL
jgi:divalent anion:Na+ symporter, DASS family